MALKLIGIVGCGAIGKALINAVAAGKLAVRVAGVTSRTEESARQWGCFDFLQSLGGRPSDRQGKSRILP